MLFTFMAPVSKTEAKKVMLKFYEPIWNAKSRLWKIHFELSRLLRIHRNIITETLFN